MFYYIKMKQYFFFQKLCFQSQEGIESSRQRWFFGGKLLGDKLRVEEAKIPPGYVVQVIINNVENAMTPPK